MNAKTSLRCLQQHIWTIGLSVGLHILALGSVVYAADQDNGRRHSLLLRPTAGSVPSVTSTQGVIVSGSNAQPPQVLDSASRPQALSPSAQPMLTPHHKLTKRPGVAIVKPAPSAPMAQSLVTKKMAAASSGALAIVPSTGSQRLSEDTVVKSSPTRQGLASATVAPTTATTRPSSALLASPSTLSSSSLASTSSGRTTTPAITGSRSAANLLQNQAITSLLQSPAPTDTSPPAVPPSIPPPSPTTGSATLMWSPNSEPDLAGYKVYVGTQSGLYTFPGSPVTIGSITSYTIINLPAGQTYFFALSAYDSQGNESTLSAEVSKSIY